MNIEQQTLLDNSYKSFVRSGANLSAEDKEKYRKITGELSKLGLQFQQNVLAETNAYELHLTDEADLAGLPEFVREAAALTAKQKEKEGWVFTLQHPSFIPFMKYSDRRDLREKLFRASSCKGNQDNEFDNKAIIKKILDLKLEKAKLLGFKSHAQFKLERRMAETPERVATFLDELHQASKSFADEDLAEVQKFANENGFEGTIQRWDWAYYSEKLKNARYGFNEEEVKPFLKLEKRCARYLRPGQATVQSRI